MIRRKHLSRESFLESRRASIRRYYARNRGRILLKKKATNRAWYLKNRDRLLARMKERRPEIASRNRIRRLTDPQFKMRHSLSERIRETLLRRGVSGKRIRECGTDTLVGGLVHVVSRMEKMFRDGMNWGNHGSVWHVDHVTPLCWFDLLCQTQRRYAFHYTNIQPLLVQENLSKGGRYSG